MRKIIRHDGINITNDALPVVTVSEHERLLAAIPGHMFWLQARETDSGQIELINDRAEWTEVAPLSVGGARWSIGTSSNGRPAIECGYSGTSVSYGTQVQMRPDAWTVALVFRKYSSASNVNDLMSSMSLMSASDKLALRININAENRIRLLAEDESPLRDRVSAVIDATQVTLAVFTFSTALGLSLRINGSAAAQNTGDVRPLLDRSVRLGAQSTVNVNGNSFEGQRMRTHLFGVDLSLPEYSGYLATLERELMSFYGIAA